ncbi:MAG: (deoxy)nucleoside triphosphate pyrophosphohydrolase [Bacteroidales bacterium]|nr:(deoxy)nucleoside triphosphate pyrophosphohydrolase [Bacteroidales bacterium]
MPERTIIPVTCAIIVHEGKVLIAQRNSRASNAHQWEFPGGKQEEGESAEECLIREIKEELSIGIMITGKLDPVTHHYPDKSIRLIPFICSYKGGPVHPEEHKKILWVKPGELSRFEWSAADIKVWHQYLEKSGYKKTGR